MSVIPSIDLFRTSLDRRVRRHGRRVVLEGALAARRLAPGARSLPDFMIVGAQRSGTTSLYRAIAEHESVLPLVLDAKGAHYFDTAAHRPLGWYRAHFPTDAARRASESRSGRPAVAGESSPYYLFHPDGPRRIAAAVPDARLIVLLRNPIDRAYSHHQHMVWEGHEPLLSFEDAIDAEDERLGDAEQRMLDDPTFVSRDHQHFSYVARGRYAPQLKRLFEHFDRDRVLVTITEELVADPAPHLAEIQRFIGLAPSPAVSLRRHNGGTYESLAAATRNRLQRQFAGSNSRTAELLGRDLPW